MTFAELIDKKVKELRSKAAIVISPCWEELPSQVKEKYKSTGAAMFVFNKALLDGVKGHAVAVLLNVQAFEVYGLGGMVCLKSTIDYAKSLGMIVIALTDKSGSSQSAIKAAAKAWIAPIDPKLPEDSPLREGAFDCDAMTYNPVALSGQNAGFVAVETERAGAGVLMDCSGDFTRGIQMAEAIDLSTCGVILRGTCTAITETVRDKNNLISLACPTGVDNISQLKELAAVCSLVVAPQEVKAPDTFIKFKEML